jgi:hypothetical protein
MLSLCVVTDPEKLAGPASSQSSPETTSAAPKNLLQPVWPGFAIDPTHHHALRNPTAKRYRTRTAADEEKMFDLLRLVGIEYLVERWQKQMDGDASGWDHVTQW